MTSDELSLSRRLIILNGGTNFRDVGGYRTADGRTVRMGRVYRSGNLVNLTDDGLSDFAALGLKHLTDFRSHEEFAEEPSRLPSGDDRPHVEHRPIAFGAQGGDSAHIAVRKLLGRAKTQDDVIAYMQTGYAKLPVESADVYRAFVVDMFDDNKVPTLFHCTAGKDRTGMAAAIYLSALGVPRQTVIHDYLMSNVAVEEQINQRMQQIQDMKAPFDPELMRPLLGVNIKFIEAALATIDKEFGGFEGYLREALQLSPTDIADLGQRFLVD